MSRLIAWSGVLCALLSFSPAARAQATGSLAGRVTDADGLPVPGAVVSVLNTSRRAATGLDGRFALVGVPTGIRDVSVRAFGYAPAVRTVRVAEGESTAFDAVLASDDASLGDIVVTAERDERRLRDSPVAVTVLSGRELESSETRTFSDLSARVPGYLYQQPGASFQASQSIRGIQVFSENPAVATVVDGVSALDIVADGLALVDVERIEVLRGPQGTLFGRTALGGVVNVVTRRPTDRLTVFGEAGGGSRGLGRIAGGASGAIVPGRVLARATGSFQTHDGYLTVDTTGTTAPRGDAAGATVGSEQTGYGHVTLDAQASPVVSATLDLTAQVDRSGASGFSIANADDAFAVANPDLVRIGRVGRHRRTLAQAALTLRASLPDVSFASTTTAQRVGLAFADIDFGGIVNSVSDAGELGAAGPPQVVFTQELRASRAGRLAVTAGAFGFTQSAAEPSTNIAIEVGPDTNALLENRARNTGGALFGQATFAATPRLSLTAGLRADAEHRRATFNGFGDRVLSGGELTVSRPDTTVASTYTALSPKLAATLRLGTNASAYVSYARGFRPGGVNAQRQPRGLALTYAPETSDNLEVGIRTTALGGRLSGALTAFAISWRDLQYFNLVAPFTFARANVGDARSRGLEAEASALPLGGLRLDASLSVLDTAYRAFVIDRVDFVTGETAQTDISGNRLANAPASTAYLAAEVRRSVGAGLGVVVRGDIRAVGPFYTDVQNTLRQDAYRVVGGRIGVTRGPVEASVWVQNLADTRFLIYGTPDSSFGRTALIGPPRTLGVTLRVRS